MKYICNWLSSLAFISQIFAFPLYAQTQNCEFRTTDQPPFFVSGVTGVSSEDFVIGTVKDDSNGDNIATENFWVDSDKSKKKSISRGTVVRLDADSTQQLELSKRIVANEKFLVPVEVIRPQEAYVRFKSKANQQLHVKAGEKGYLWSQSMNAAGQFEYRVNRDSTFFELNPKQGSLELKRGTTLSPVVTQDGKFKIYVCCSEGNAKCTQTYVFEARSYNSDETVKAVQVGLSADKCETMDLQPLKSGSIRDLESMSALLQKEFSVKNAHETLDINDWGYMRLPLTGERVGTGITGVGPGETFVHYQGGDPQYSDTWGKPYAICSLLKLAKKWKEQCKGKGCLPQVGDLAFATPVSKMESGGGPLGHATHHNGECIDIRPFRKDDNLEASTYNSAEYSVAQTKKFLELAIDLGASPVYFNDPNIAGQVKGVARMKGHDNHLHICFPKAAAAKHGC